VGYGQRSRPAYIGGPGMILIVTGKTGKSRDKKPGRPEGYRIPDITRAIMSIKAKQQAELKKILKAAGAKK